MGDAVLTQMTAEEYYQAVSTYDQRKLQAQIDAIPLNINRAGRLYRKLLKQIHEKRKHNRN
jgi:hypothetical protein